MPSEKRQHPRVQVHRPVQLRWLDERGRQHQTNAHIVDLSRRGARIETLLRPPLFGLVQIVENTIPLRGSALVRYIATDFTGPARIGLEFCGGLLTPKAFLDTLLAADNEPTAAQNIFT